MSRFGAWKPLAANWASQSRMTAPDIISLHTMVGSLEGVDSMWRKTAYAGSYSHFGVGYDGAVWQWQDTAYRAAANYNGNHHIISVETADRGTGFPAWNINDGSAVPAWLPAQVEALAQLIAAMCKAHNIPCVLIPDAKPGRRGIGYHRQGVPGYMVAGAEQWSTAQGKVCPGNRRITQIPQVIARAQQILGGAATPIQEDELSAQFEAEARAALADLANKIGGLQYIAVSPNAGSQGELLDRVRSIDAGVAAILAQAPGGQIDASTIAAAIPGNLAKQVADELTKRLAD